MKDDQHRAPLSKEAFVEWLTREGSTRYHDHHPFHKLMHEGNLTKVQLQQWVLNRYYYQTRIPIKDALIVSKSEDPSFRRTWLHRIQDHDGQQEGEGGLTSWLELARGVGLDVEEVRSLRSVLPGVRLACDGYVQFVRDSSLLEAVASSLTELFAPTLMSRRIEAWKHHYPWVSSDALGYFQMRIACASLDSKQAVEFVVQHALTYELQERCVRALIKKAEILWHLLDCLHMTNRMTGDISRPQLSPKVRLRFDRRTGRYLLLYPETGLELSRTATEIARLCTGEWTVDDIAQYLAQIHTEISPGEIMRDVRDFLKTLAGRGLLQGFK